MKFFTKNKLLLVMIIYLFVTIVLYKYNVVFYKNIVSPIFWLVTSLYILGRIKRNYFLVNKNKKYVISLTILIVIYAIFCYLLGLKIGFVASPYKHSLNYLLINIIVQTLPICSIELVREFIIKKNKKSKNTIIISTVVLILLEINYNKLTGLTQDKLLLFEYICSDILPLIFSSILYTYLTFKNSYILPLTIKFISNILLLILPIYPDLDWFERGALYILFDSITYCIFKYRAFKYEPNAYREKIRKEEKVKWKVSLIFYVLLMCFMLGVFKYSPITIMSNSMKPNFSRGDVVIYKKLDDSEIKDITIGSIIIFESSNRTTVHRVVAMENIDGTIYYKTKGDSNNSLDNKLVSFRQIKGIYVFHIKYLGFPSVWLYECLNN